MISVCHGWCPHDLSRRSELNWGGGRCIGVHSHHPGSCRVSPRTWVPMSSYMQCHLVPCVGLSFSFCWLLESKLKIKVSLILFPIPILSCVVLHTLELVIFHLLLHHWFCFYLSRVSGSLIIELYLIARVSTVPMERSCHYACAVACFSPRSVCINNSTIWRFFCEWLQEGF